MVTCRSHLRIPPFGRGTQEQVSQFPPLCKHIPQYIFGILHIDFSLRLSGNALLSQSANQLLDEGRAHTFSLLHHNRDHI
ncbi:hypothetical protein BGLA2_2060002 [Burkholderia gladioli]|nr:hypothetical protein BGLA2_2060002 [Burkholderia gladioli]